MKAGTCAGLLLGVFSATPAFGQTVTVCASLSNVPDGYVVTNIYTQRTICGGHPATNNVMTIINARKFRSGSTLEMCAWGKIPAGWRLVPPWTYTRHGRCGSYTYTNNVWPIRTY
jgi:hypothetical protein